MSLKNGSYIERFYRVPGLAPQKTKDLLELLSEIEVLKKFSSTISKIETELCYYVEINGEKLSNADEKKLQWILGIPHNPKALQKVPHLKSNAGESILIEIGPRFNFSTPNSSNSVSICKSLQLHQITRIEVSRRYLISYAGKIKGKNIECLEKEIIKLVHDRMTECQYTDENIPKKSFNEKLVKKDDLKDVDIMRYGRKALEQINNEMGLAFDDADLDYYTRLFKDTLKRNPTSVECFDLAQSNSEHSRHWFFKGKMVVDGVEQKETLIDMIIKTQDNSNQNNVIKFSDNSR